MEAPGRGGCDVWPGLSMVFAHCLVQLGTREWRGWGALEVNIPGTCWIPALPCHCSHFIDKDAHTGYVPCQGPTGQMLTTVGTQSQET